MTEGRAISLVNVMAFVSVALALSVQGGAAIWWAGVMESRVATLEQWRVEADAVRPGQLAEVARLVTQVAVMEERLRRFDDAVGRLEGAILRLETLARGQ